MSAGFLGRLFRLGKALVSYGLGGSGGAPPVPVAVSIVGVCVTRPVAMGPIVYRREARSPVATVAIAEGVTVSRRAPDVITVRRPLPEC